MTAPDIDSTLTAIVPATTTTTDGRTTVGAEVRVAAEDGGKGKSEDKENTKMQSEGHVSNVVNDVEQIQVSHSLSCAAQTRTTLRAFRALLI